MDQRLRFLIVGLGLIGRAHLSRVSERADCVVSGVVDPKGPTSLPGSFPEVLFYGSVEDALRHGAFDGAIISSPNSLHYAQTLACIEACLPTLVEKPLTDDVVTARALVEASARRNVPVMVGHHRAHSPLMETARVFMKTPAFGRLVAIQGSALFYKPADYFAAGPWRSQPGGGPALINLIHEIGIMRDLGGEIDSVFTFASHAIRGFQVEDTLALGLRFHNGCLGTFILSDTAASNKSWEMTSGENEVYPFFEHDYAYHIAGTNGSFDFPSLQARSYSSDKPPSWWRLFDTEILTSARSDPLRRQIAHFVEVIRGSSKPLVSALDGFRNMVVLDAVLASARTGRSVAVVP